MKNLQDYCITLETARRLYEAGITKCATFYVWDNLSYLRLRIGNEFQLCSVLSDGKTVPADYVAYPALTLHELMEVMPYKIGRMYLTTGMNENGPYAEFLYADEKHGLYNPVFQKDSMMESLEALAIHLLDNSLWPLSSESRTQSRT